MGFHSYEIVTARKLHRCAHCFTPINIGDRHRKSAQVFDGQFDAYREHIECYNAWSELNFKLRDLPADEGAPFLGNDDTHEPEDRAWMWEEHPLVAARLGWLALTAQEPRHGRD